jgi:hypothetical protein
LFGKRNDQRSRSRTETVLDRNLTLTLDPKSKFGSEGVLPGAYRRHHHRWRCLGAHRADVQGESSARRTSTARRFEGQGREAPSPSRSTVARSPSGERTRRRGGRRRHRPPPCSPLAAMAGVLSGSHSFAGAREERERQGKRDNRKGVAGCGLAPGGAAPHCRRSSPVTGLTTPPPLELGTDTKEKKSTEKRRGERRQRPLAGRRSASPSPAGTPATGVSPAAADVAPKEAGKREKGLGFAGDLAEAVVLSRRQGQRTVHQDGRPGSLRASGR